MAKRPMKSLISFTRELAQMNDDRGTNSTPAGLYLGTQKQPTLLIEWIGIALAIQWLGVSAYVLLNNATLAAGMLTSILLIFMPVCILWVSVMVIRTSHRMKQESQQVERGNRSPAQGLY